MRADEDKKLGYKKVSSTVQKLYHIICTIELLKNTIESNEKIITIDFSNASSSNKLQYFKDN